MDSQADAKPDREYTEGVTSHGDSGVMSTHKASHTTPPSLEDVLLTIQGTKFDTQKIQKREKKKSFCAHALFQSQSQSQSQFLSFSLDSVLN
jgi:hypothetical protein